VVDEDFSELRSTIRLTRSEAARYVGVSGESTIRAAEANGLACERDWGGQIWHVPSVLDAWAWRLKGPTAAQKARVLRDAARARKRECTERIRHENAEAERVFAELDAEREREKTLREQEQTLREEVRRRNEETRAAFASAYLDEATAAKALGFRFYQASYRLRDLVGRGFLRRFDGPREVRVEPSFDGLRAVETQWPLCRGGPFFLREEVLALRREATEVAAEVAGRDPRTTQTPESDDGLAALVRLLLEHAGRTPPPG
jgi:hypothetical protein